jgi:hypothetical protein
MSQGPKNRAFGLNLHATKALRPKKFPEEILAACRQPENAVFP